MIFFKSLKIKVGDMKKVQDFTCYGFKKDSNEVIFQSKSNKIYEYY